MCEVDDLKALVHRFRDNPDSLTWDELRRLLRAGLIRRSAFGFGYSLTGKGAEAVRPPPERWEISR